MRILLAGLEHLRPKDPRISLGVASIAANLARVGADFAVESVNVASENGSEPDLAPLLARALSPDFNHKGACLMLGAFVWNEPYIQHVLQVLEREKFAGKVAIGGPQVTYADKGTLEGHYPRADMFIRGYAEHAVAGLWAGELAVPGVHYRGRRDAGMQAWASLDTLPSPHLEGWLPVGDFVRWETQRGCPYTCRFCQHRQPIFPDGSRVARAGEDRVADEIALFCASNATAELAVLDPTFNTDTDRAVHVLDQLKANGFAGRLELQVRPERLTDRFLDAIERLGAEHVVLELGIQSTNVSELFAIERSRGTDPAALQTKVASKLGKVRERNMQAEVSLIFGLPGQTVASFAQSIADCRAMLPEAKLVAFPLMLLRGTQLHADRARLGLVEGTVDHPLTGRIQQFIPHVVESPTMTRADWTTMADMAAAL